MFIGNKEIIKKIQARFDNHKIYGTWLFYGQASLGKSLVAQSIISTIIKGQNNFKNELTNLAKVNKAIIVKDNVKWIEPIQHNNNRIINVDMIRSVNRFLHHTHEKTAMLVVNKAEYLNRHASNALLKIIEEPPLRSVVIIVTDNISQLSATITSRCQKFFFCPVPMSEIDPSQENNKLSQGERLRLLCCNNSPGLYKIFLNIPPQEFLSLKEEFFNVLANKKSADIINNKLFMLDTYFLQFIDALLAYMLTMKYGCDKDYYNILSNDFSMQHLLHCKNYSQKALAHNLKQKRQEAIENIFLPLEV